MALVSRLARLFEERRVPYQVIPHREAFTAEAVAQVSHVARRHVAKAVVIRTGVSDYLMCVLPASEHLDLETVRRVTGRHVIEFAAEGELKRLFPDCELGAMPPFGGLYGMPACLDACFFRELEGDLYFQGGNHHEIVRIAFEDYRRSAGPFVHEACLHERQHVAI